MSDKVFDERLKVDSPSWKICGGENWQLRREFGPRSPNSALCLFYYLSITIPAHPRYLFIARIWKFAPAQIMTRCRRHSLENNISISPSLLNYRLLGSLCCRESRWHTSVAGRPHLSLLLYTPPTVKSHVASNFCLSHNLEAAPLFKFCSLCQSSQIRLTLQPYLMTRQWSCGRSGPV